MDQEAKDVVMDEVLLCVVKALIESPDEKCQKALFATDGPSDLGMYCLNEVVTCADVVFASAEEEDLMAGSGRSGSGMTSGWGSGMTSGWGSGMTSGWGSGMDSTMMSRSGWGSGSGGPSWSSANADGASGRCLMDATIQNQNEDSAKALAQADEKE